MDTKQQLQIFGKRSHSRLFRIWQRSLLIGAVVACLLPQTLLAAVTSNVTGTVLTVTSDAEDDIVITCDPALNVKINGADPNPAPTLCATLTEIKVSGSPLTNTIDLSGVTVVSFTALLTASVDGLGANDVITGTEIGDTLNGGDGDDLIIGHRGADTMNGDGGNDTLVWNPGDGSDIAVGGDGDDTVLVIGGNVSETFTISGTATGALFQRLNPNPFSVDIISPTENLLLNANGGADIVTGTAGLNGVITLTINGGDGDDNLRGGNGPDILNGEEGNDLLVGAQGADTMNGGPGNDTMVWNPGDGSDVMAGGDGDDTAVINGGNVDETFTISGTTTGALFRRVDPNPFSVDIISPTETLLLNANGGNDIVTGTAGLSGVITLTLNGGDGDDNITGGNGPDTLNGEAGNDLLVGAQGRDTMNGGPGDDIMVWNPGDGSDIMDGGDGNDLALVNGGNVSETFAITPAVTVRAARPNVPLVGSIFFERITPGVFTLEIEAEGVELNGNGGSDEFDVTPLPNATVHFNGGDPSSDPSNPSLADILRVDAQENIVKPVLDEIRVEGRQPVSHENVEIVEIENDPLPVKRHLPFVVWSWTPRAR